MARWPAPCYPGTMIRPKKLPRDPVQRAKAIMDLAAGDAVVPPEPAKNPHAVALSKLGASKGGIARKKALTKAERAAIARKAARTRWGRP